MDYAEIREIVVDELTKRISEKDINTKNLDIEKLKFSELAFDSLDILEFSMHLEDRLDLELETGDFPRGGTVTDFISYLSTLK